MLKTIKLLDNPSVDRLSQLWAERYVPDLSTLSYKERNFSISELLDAASPKGRTRTVAKLERMVEIRCQCAGIKTNIIFSYIPNVVNLTESRGIATVAAQVYQKILEVYQKQAMFPGRLVNLPNRATVDVSNEIFRSSVMPRLSFAEVKQLAMEIEPVLLNFQERHLASGDRRTIGFMSTQFHLSAKLVLNRLTLPEQLLLSPYFKFVEEQVCIPWQRVCSAAAQHNLDSPILVLAQQLLPLSPAIAKKVYSKAVQMNPNHRSLRGGLSNPGVRASSIRDIEMFQAYLWLCALEGNMSAVEQELLPLCMMVFPSIDVSWKLIEQLLPSLVAEIENRVSSEQMHLLIPYTQAMQHMFSNLEAKAAGKVDDSPLRTG
ncbi:MAG TPA: hypothetical protein V6D50_27160 [Chroococcales cyanobacterium]|jgi:hypothetical protein